MTGWDLTGTHATFRAGRNDHLALDVATPQNGLAGLDRDLCPFRIEEPTGLGGRLVDCFVRGDDLIADYSSEEDQPYQLRLYWSAREMSVGVVFDFSVVVRTPSWVCTPRLIVNTQFDGDAELLFGKHCVPNGFTWDTLETNQVASEAGVCLVRDRERWRLLEMVFPTDLQKLEKQDGAICYRLLGQPLEKGVIRRTRIRTVVRPDMDDLAEVDHIWNQFLGEPLPLTP